MDEEIEITNEIKTKLREEQNRLVKIIVALEKLETNKEWSTLKELVFNKSLQAIERQLLVESTAQELKIEKLYRLQGEWAWAKQYTDTGRFIETLKKQLEEIKKRLQ